MLIFFLILYCYIVLILWTPIVVLWKRDICKPYLFDNVGSLLGLAAFSLFLPFFGIIPFLAMILGESFESKSAENFDNYFNKNSRLMGVKSHEVYEKYYGL